MLKRRAADVITSLPWPLVTIDFEASSLDPAGYPIEVGLAVWPRPDEPIKGWSALICPTTAWLRDGHWSSASAKVHGLRGRDLLASGWPAERVARTLNAVIWSGGTAWCDGGPYDAEWARMLFRAANLSPTFVLDDWHRLAMMLGKVARERALTRLTSCPAKHRARADAEQLLLALADAAEIGVGPVEDLYAAQT